jgi:hypothetical protein
MKPGDFFLGVVNFLGVLVPGAILIFLRGWTSYVTTDVTEYRWLVIGGASYVLGQFLLGTTEILNEIARKVPGRFFVQPDVVLFRDDARKQLGLLKEGSEQAQFHAALSYLRIKDAAAAVEIDHHMADYKLLRNLLAILAIDLLARTLGYPKPESQAVIFLESLALVACFIAFVRMFNWAQLLSFQYVCLIKGELTKPPKTEGPI